MNTLLLFTIEIAISLGISLTVISLLKGLLTEVLSETCGTERRAAFWVMFTQLMLYLAPLLIVIYFIPTDPVSDKNLLLALKDTLFYSLLGMFLGLAVIGKVIWKSIDSFVSNQTKPNGVEE
ncbi:MAG: hypothetical protein G8D61_01300 [gamma proteobacterium symbiont of Ctena orbiculata]|nr:hypothetical protein [Candidatus Thiodiazotropha sp. (ex Codakia orbicularis)]